MTNATLSLSADVNLQMSFMDLKRRFDPAGAPLRMSATASGCTTDAFECSIALLADFRLAHTLTSEAMVLQSKNIDYDYCLPTGQQKAIMWPHARVNVPTIGIGVLSEVMAAPCYYSEAAQCAATGAKFVQRRHGY